MILISYHCYKYCTIFCTQLEKIPGILIFRFLAPLCFLSSPAFRRRLELAAQMDKKHWNKEEGGCLKTLFVKVIWKWNVCCD